MARRNGLQHHERCTNCEQPTADGRGKCNRCAVFYSRHGYNRPQVEGRLVKVIYRGQLCRTCKERPAVAKRRCNPCYSRMWRRAA